MEQKVQSESQQAHAVSFYVILDCVFLKISSPLWAVLFVIMGSSPYLRSKTNQMIVCLHSQLACARPIISLDIIKVHTDCKCPTFIRNLVQIFRSHIFDTSLKNNVYDRCDCDRSAKTFSISSSQNIFSQAHSKTYVLFTFTITQKLGCAVYLTS